jgi:hypothetical protein
MRTPGITKGNALDARMALKASAGPVGLGANDRLSWLANLPPAYRPPFAVDWAAGSAMFYLGAICWSLGSAPLLRP